MGVYHLVMETGPRQGTLTDSEHRDASDVTVQCVTAHGPARGPARGGTDAESRGTVTGGTRGSEDGLCHLS